VTDCRRCDWCPDRDADVPARQQLAEHALAASHPLCACCANSLSLEDPRIACERCLSTARERLAGIALMHDELRRHLGRLTGRSVGPGGGDHQLPGGTVLALLGPGSVGGASRFGDDYEPHEPERWWVKGAVGPLTQAGLLQAERERWGREHAIDNLPSDAPSVEQELWSWAQEWSESGAGPLPSGRLTVWRLHGYLEVHARWAANEHEAFDEFCDDMRKLHLSLEQATGRHRAPTRAGATCFDCSADLVHPLVEQPAERWWVAGRYGPLPEHEVVRSVGLVEQAARGLDGEEYPVVVCVQCERQYDPHRYSLALKAKIEAGSQIELDGEQYATRPVAARIVGRSENTLTKWWQEGAVRAHRRRGVLFFNLSDLAECDATRGRRARSA
jgi:hypothetical protein